MNEQKDYHRLIKSLQITSAVFMLLTLAACVILLRKYDISVRNLGALQGLLRGGALAVAVYMILFSAVKSFALVFPVAILYALSGIFFESLWQALLVNAIATALSLSLPYFMGRFTGRAMMEALRRRFPKVKRLDDFAGANDFALVLLMKISGILASDLSSLIFGALDIPYRTYILAANLGMLPLNIMWTLLGSRGDLSNPRTFLYILPIVIFTVLCAVAVKKFEKNNKK